MEPAQLTPTMPCTSSVQGLTLCVTNEPHITFMANIRERGRALSHCCFQSARGFGRRPSSMQPGMGLSQCPGSFWAYIVRQDPSDSKSNQLHVDIFQFCFYSFEEVYSVDSSKMIRNSPEISNFNRLDLKLNRFLVCN